MLLLHFMNQNHGNTVLAESHLPVEQGLPITEARLGFLKMLHKKQLFKLLPEENTFIM